MESSNLQMIQEQEGENQLYQTHTQDMDMQEMGVADGIGGMAAGVKQTEVQRIENNINLIHQKEQNAMEMQSSVV